MVKIENNIKSCSKCKRELNISNFSKDKQQKSGYKCWCKDCRSVASKNLRDTREDKPEWRTRLTMLRINWRNKAPEKHISALFQCCRNRANRLGIPYDITQDFIIDLFKKQSGECFYSGITMTCIAGQGMVDTNVSIERLNPAIGYIKGNVVLCCYFINVSKRDRGIDEWLDWANKVLTFKNKNKEVFNAKSI